MPNFKQHTKVEKKVTHIYLALILCFLMGVFNISINLYQSWFDHSNFSEKIAYFMNKEGEFVKSGIEERLKVPFRILAMASHLNAPENSKLANLSSLFRSTLVAPDIYFFDKNNKLILQSNMLERDEFTSVIASGKFLEYAHANPGKVFTETITYKNTLLLLVIQGRIDDANQQLPTIVVSTPLTSLVTTADLINPDYAFFIINENQKIIRSDLVDKTEIIDAKQIIKAPSDKYFDSYSKTNSVLLINGEDYLTQQHKILLPDEEKWTLLLAVRDELAYKIWKQSLYINLTGIITLLISLGLSVFCLQKELKSIKRLKTRSEKLEMFISKIPSPIVLIDKNTSHIIFGNEFLFEGFGSLAAVGSPFEQLFVEPKEWGNILSSHDENNKHIVKMLTRNGPLYMLIQFIENINDIIVIITDIDSQYQSMQKTQLDSKIDTLTGLSNRRGFDVLASSAVEEAKKLQIQLSVLYIDLDFFKQVNDGFGHAAGDIVLETVARIFGVVLRTNDIAARLGGEEFIVLLPDTSIEHAKKVAERIRSTIANTPINLPDERIIQQTVSIGVSIYHPGEADLSAAQSRADIALYCAKNAGRNNVKLQDNTSAVMV